MNDPKLAYAKEHVFMAGVDDSGARLCEANMPYGLAKIHHVQAELGLPQDASFIGSPDCTITRNRRRWQQGFGYGGVCQWTGDFAVLDIKSNACGVLVGSLPEIPEHEALRERLRILERDGLMLDGTPIDIDLTESNHFLDLLTVDPKEQKEEAPLGAKHFFFMHSSGHEHRSGTDLGPGLYYDESEELVSLARRIDTPWGDIRILEGEKAERWYEFYKRAEDFVFRRRELLAKHLFDEFTVTINATHQGLVRGYNQANLGCYQYDRRDGSNDGLLFPLTLSPELPCYLVRGKRNLSISTIAALGWDERLDRHGLRDRISETNFLPHGGGYRYTQFSGVARVIEEGPDKRYFELASTSPDQPNPTIATPRDLPFEYRGMEVKDRVVELGLGDPVIKLDLDYVL